MKLYKVLVDGKSAHGGNLKWSLPKKVEGKWVEGKWQSVKGKLEICERGLHLTSKPENWYKVGCRVYEAEYKGLGENTEDKYVVSSARLIKEVPIKGYRKDVEKFIYSLKDIPWMKNDNNPKKEWRLFETRDAAWDAAWNAARDAAWNAAWDAARCAAQNTARDAAWYAVWNAAWDSARDAVWDAVWDAARGVARDAARDAAQDAVWDAARDAALKASILVCKGVKFSEKQVKHSNDRMEVWKKGYGLLCDVDGVLYVYKKL